MDSLNYENLEETCQNITDTMIDRINHLHEQGANDEAIALWEEHKEWIQSTGNQEVMLVASIANGRATLL